MIDPGVLDQLETAFPWLTLAGVIMALLSMLAIPWLVVRMPSDYFVAPERRSAARGPLGWTIWALRNLLAVVLIMLGILMLVLPGQGLLTILIGVASSTFPGKYRLERRLVRHRRIMAALNWIRRKNHRPPLQPPEPGHD